MRPEILKIIFLKELRELLRDRRALAVMFGIPLLLYPLATLVMANVGQARQKEMTEKPARIAVVDPTGAPHLIEMGRKDESVTIPPVNDSRGALRENQVDAVLTIPEHFESDSIQGKAASAIHIDVDRSRSNYTFVERRVKKFLDNYEQWIIQQRLQTRGIDSSILAPIKRDIADVATGDQRLGNLMGLMLPLLLLITGMLGALFPAFSATTTERELGTLETLLVSPAGRLELLVAKGALVLLCALVTAGLNLLSMSLVMWRTFSVLEKTMGTMTLDPMALVLSYVAMVPSLIIFTAIVMIVGMLARNFREANSFATPLMLLPTSSLFVMIAEPKPTPALLVTPVINTSLIIKEVLAGRASFMAFALAWTSSLIYAGMILGFAVRLFSNEQLVNPSWEPVSLKGLRKIGKKAVRRLPAPDEALAIFGLSLLALFYVQPSLAKWGLLSLLSTTEIFLVAGPAILFAIIGRYRWRETFHFQPAKPVVLAASALLGIGLAIWISMLHVIQSRFWPGNPELARMMEELFRGPLRDHPVLTILLVGGLAGICEELLYRGPIQTGLIRRLPPGVAITLTAALFALAHLDMQGAPLRFVLGWVLGWIVYRGGSIYPAMVLHGVFDSFQVAVAAVGEKWPSAEHYLALGPGASWDAASFVRLILGAGLIVGSLMVMKKYALKRPETSFSHSADICVLAQSRSVKKSTSS